MNGNIENTGIHSFSYNDLYNPDDWVDGLPGEATLRDANGISQENSKLGTEYPNEYSVLNQSLWTGNTLGGLNVLQDKMLKEIKSFYSPGDSIDQLFFEHGPVFFCNFLCEQIDKNHLSQKQVLEAISIIRGEKTTHLMEGKSRCFPGVYQTLSHSGDDQKIVRALCDLFDRLDNESVLKLLTINAPVALYQGMTLNHLLRDGVESNFHRFADLMQYVKERMGDKVVERVLRYSAHDLESSYLAGEVSRGHPSMILALTKMYLSLDISPFCLVKWFDCERELKGAIEYGYAKGVMAYCQALQSIAVKFNDDQKAIILKTLRNAELKPSFFGTSQSKEFALLCKKEPKLYEVYKATKNSLKP